MGTDPNDSITITDTNVNVTQCPTCGYEPRSHPDQKVIITCACDQPKPMQDLLKACQSKPDGWDYVITRWQAGSPLAGEVRISRRRQNNRRSGRRLMLADWWQPCPPGVSKK